MSFRNRSRIRNWDEARSGGRSLSRGEGALPMDVAATLAAAGEGGNAGAAGLSGSLLPQALEPQQARPVPFGGDLEGAWNVEKSRVIHEAAESARPDFTLAHVPVPADAAPRRLQRVVE